MIGAFPRGCYIDLLPEYKEITLVANRDFVLDLDYNQRVLWDYGFVPDDFRTVTYRKLLASLLIRRKLMGFFIKH